MATILGTTTSKGAGNYIGETKKQLRDGFGVFNYANKFFRYEGEWSKGKKHGHGKLLMGDGGFYEGQFHDGEIQGHGFRYWASSGNQYTGQLMRGELYGHGVMKYGNGSQYEGEWMNNRREGSGKLIEKDGCEYEGSFHEHKRHGEGKQTYSNGDIYEGDWVKDLRQGHGIIKTGGGSIYAGQWWGGVYHGEGSMVHCSGMTYEGIWVSGRPEVEAAALRIVGKAQIDVTQGRPFGFEVECVTLDGDPVTEEGRMVQVTGWLRITGRKTPTEQDERLTTPFGFEIEPYYLTESLGDLSGENLGSNPVPTAPSSSMSHRPAQTSSPTYDSAADITSRQVDSVHIPEVTYEGASDTGSIAESQLELPNRTAAPSQASTMHNSSFDKGIPTTDEIVMPPPPSTARTTSGKAVFENLYLPPLPPGVKSFTSITTTEARPPEYERRSSLMRWKKAGSTANSNLLAKANVPTSIGEGGKKRKGKEDLADVVSEAKEAKGRKKDKKEDKTDERLCKPGDYVIVVQDVTTPRFLDSRLAPAFVHVRVNLKKRAKSKMDSRKN